MAAKNAVEQFVDAQMDVAVELSTEKEELYGRIAANRSILRNLVTTGQVSDEQAVWIADHYPVKARKNGDEADTTDES